MSYPDTLSRLEDQVRQLEEARVQEARERDKLRSDSNQQRRLLHACREAMRISQRFHPQGTDWSHMVEAIDKEIGPAQTVQSS